MRTFIERGINLSLSHHTDPHTHTTNAHVHVPVLQELINPFLLAHGIPPETCSCCLAEVTELATSEVLGKQTEPYILVHLGRIACSHYVLWSP
jgi:hypothetical protein